MLISKFGNPVAPSQIKLREANRFLNKQLQVQQALLMDQSKTIQDAQETILEFNKMAEE